MSSKLEWSTCLMKLVFDNGALEDIGSIAKPVSFYISSNLKWRILTSQANLGRQSGARSRKPEDGRHIIFPVGFSAFDNSIHKKAFDIERLRTLWKMPQAGDSCITRSITRTRARLRTIIPSHVKYGTQRLNSW